MEVYVFTEVFVDDDKDLDMHKVMVFADEEFAKDYFKCSANALEANGYCYSWWEEDGECWDDSCIMQAYYVNDEKETFKLISLSKKEVR